MAGTRTTNTMQEGMVGLLQQIAMLKAAPDADLDTLSNLEMQVLDVVKKPQRDAMERIAQAGGVVPGMTGGGGGAGPAGPSPGGMPPPDMGMMMPQGPPPGSEGNPLATQTPYRPAGVRNGGAMPPVDELRRLIASSGVA